MFRSEFTLNRVDNGMLELSVVPAPGEEAAAGRVVDYFTPTGESDRLQPAQPDDQGEIRRTLAPDVMPPQVGFVLESLGFTLQ